MSLLSESAKDRDHVRGSNRVRSRGSIISKVKKTSRFNLILWFDMSEAMSTHSLDVKKGRGMGIVTSGRD